jgi:capsid protein
MAAVIPEPVIPTTLDGTKFPAGFGETRVYSADYWTLRTRSAQVFKDNLYARGLIRRLVTNVINTGLTLEATPIADLIPLAWTEDDWTEWSEDVEGRFELWGADARVCDYQSLQTWPEIQQTVYREAVIEGDVLVIARTGPAGVPRIQIIPGSMVGTPWGKQPREGNKITQGVERDSLGRHIAFWVKSATGEMQRIPAIGEKSGRRIAWLVYGTDKRHAEVRGEPLLSLVLQSVKEIDRYRDAAQRKALLNAILAIFVTKNGERLGSGPLTGGATRRISGQVTGTDGSPRQFNISNLVPGLMVEEMQAGEEVKAHGLEGTDIRFGEFESAIVSGLAWAHEIPPEILTLAFRQNYSASRAAVNELKSFLDRERGRWASNLLAPVYQEYFTAMVAGGRIEAPGFLAVARDVAAYELAGAWLAADWNGAIKQSVDIQKEVGAYAQMIAEGLITHDRAARDVSGMKFSRLIRRLKKENQLKAEAMKPLGGFNPSGASQPQPATLDESEAGE